MSWVAPPYYHKGSKFYEQKKAKAEKIIAEQQAIIEECDKHINEKTTDSNKA